MKDDKKAVQAQEELEKKFGSVIQLSVKVLRPMEKYPYERVVWESEIRVPVAGSSKHVQTVTEAWVKTMEAGVEMAGWSISGFERPLTES